MPELPRSVQTLVIGAGVHGLSTAWHLAAAGSDVLLIDKADVAAGASGIACGVVRNNYFQPAMNELMAACVEIWESDPETFHYTGSGYLALGPEAQVEDLTAIHERQREIGYPSQLVVGEADVAAYMRTIYPDWRAEGIAACLHERAGGFAFNRESMHGLAAKARAAGARIATGVEALGFERDGSGAVTAVETSGGRVAVEQVVVAVGPWIPRLWELLDLPARIDVRQPDGQVAEDVPMWTYWYLQEGEIAFDPREFVTASGAPSPVLHVDSDAPLYDDAGELVTDGLWGIYVKPDRDSVQGGAMPLRLDGDLELDPYPTGSSDDEFPRMWSAALSHCLARFDGAHERYRHVRCGGAGAFTADSFPVFDFMADNVYVIADSNHGYKMIAVGREVARVLGGESSALLEPFRFERFETGDLHPVSNSPYPWS